MTRVCQWSSWGIDFLGAGITQQFSGFNLDEGALQVLEIIWTLMRLLTRTQRPWPTVMQPIFYNTVFTEKQPTLYRLSCPFVAYKYLLLPSDFLARP